MMASRLDITQIFWDVVGDGFVQITNRANLQIRAINEISFDVLEHLQAIALASQNNEIDHLRNIMSSPTAGIDQRQLIDTRSLVKELDRYISSHPHLAELPPKFSIGFDGGEAASISNFHNEIHFVAVQEDSNVYFRLYLSVEKDKLLVDAGILLKLEECLPIVIALMEAYLEGVDLYKNEINSEKKPRLRQILQQWGIDSFLDRVSCHLSFPLLDRPINIHFTGCSKSCAQNTMSDITLLGTIIPKGNQTVEGYHVYIKGKGERFNPHVNNKFGQLVYSNVLAEDIPSLIEQILQNNYQTSNSQYLTLDRNDT